MQQIAELTSLGLSISSIILHLAVVTLFFKSIHAALKKKTMDVMDWFLIGIFATHLGDTLDSSYWVFPWTAKFLGLESTAFLMESGVFANIPFRQILGGFGAYCHVKAHYKFNSPTNRRHELILKYAVLAGFAYSVLLIVAS